MATKTGAAAFEFRPWQQDLHDFIINKAPHPTAIECFINNTRGAFIYDDGPIGKTVFMKNFTHSNRYIKEIKIYETRTCSIGNIIYNYLHMLGDIHGNKEYIYNVFIDASYSTNISEVLHELIHLKDGTYHVSGHNRAGTINIGHIILFLNNDMEITCANYPKHKFNKYVYNYGHGLFTDLHSLVHPKAD